MSLVAPIPFANLKNPHEGVSTTLYSLMQHLTNNGREVYFDPHTEPDEEFVRHKIEIGSNTTTCWNGILDKFDSDVVFFYSCSSVRVPDQWGAGNYFEFTFYIRRSL